VPEPSACGGMYLAPHNTRSPLLRTSRQPIFRGTTPACRPAVVSRRSPRLRSGGPRARLPDHPRLQHAKILVLRSRAGPPPRVREAASRRRAPGRRIALVELRRPDQFFVINLEGRGVTFDVMMLDVVWVAEFAAAAGWHARPLALAVPRAELRRTFRPRSRPPRGTAACGRCRWLMNVGVLYYRTDLLARSIGWPRRGPGEALVDQVVRVARRRARSKTEGGRLAGRSTRAHRQRAGGDLGQARACSAPTAPSSRRRARGRVGKSFLARADRLRREPVVGDRGRRGAEPAPLRRRAARSSCATGPTRWTSSRRRVAGARPVVGIRARSGPCRRRLAKRAASSGGAHLGVTPPHAPIPRWPRSWSASWRAPTRRKALTVGRRPEPTRMALYRDPDVVRVRSRLSRPCTT